DTAFTEMSTKRNAIVLMAYSFCRYRYGIFRMATIWRTHRQRRPALRLLQITRRWAIPQISGNSVQVVHNFSSAHGQLANELLGAHQLRVVHVYESVFTMLYTQHCNISRRTN